MNYSNVELIGDTTSIEGTGNIDVEPMFVDAGNGNFHLLGMDTNHLNIIDLAPPSCGEGCVDYDDDARPFGEGMDIGADEVIQ